MAADALGLTSYTSFVITPPPIGEQSIVVTVSVRVCVCLSAIICSELHTRSSQIFVNAIHVRGSILLCRRSDTLRTSGFMDDVTFAHRPGLLDVAAQSKHSAHAALGLAIKLQANGRTGLVFGRLKYFPRWQHRERSLRSVTTENCFQ